MTTFRKKKIRTQNHSIRALLRRKSDKPRYETNDMHMIEIEVGMKKIFEVFCGRFFSRFDSVATERRMAMKNLNHLNLFYLYVLKRGCFAVSFENKFFGEMIELVLL